MAQTSFPFENVDTTETQFSQMFRNLNAGVNGTPAGTELKVTAGTGLAVSIAAGQAMVRGHYYISTAAEALALTAANGSNPRIDAIVLTLDPTANSVILAKVDGTPAGSPVAPTLTQTDAGVYQYLLATVLVPAAATVPSTITDARGFMGSRFGLWSTAGRPVAPVQGQVGFNTTLNAAEGWDGSAWVLIGAAPNINFIANGDFSKWSRGTTFTDTASAITLTGPDRWNIYAGTTARTITRQDITASSVAGARYALRYQRDVGNSSTTAGYLSTVVGTADSLRLAGQTVALSFYARAGANFSASSGNITAQVRSGTGIDENPNSFTGQAFPVSSAVTLTTSWQRFTLTGTIASTAKELATWFQFIPTGTAGANDYFEVTGVQLESGTVASSFKPAGSNSALDTVTTGSAGFDGVLVATGSSTNGSLSGTPAWAGYDVAGKNKVINGGFDFWQRGTSVSVGSAFTYTADRWFCYRQSLSTGMTVSRQAAFAPNTYYSARVQRDSGNTSTSALWLEYNAESSNTAILAGQTVTLSFWARAGANFSSTSNILAMNVVTGTGTDQRIAAGLTGAVSTYVDRTLTTTAQRFSVTVNVPANATQVCFQFVYTPTGTAGGADYYEISGVQLEVGSVATPFSRAGGTMQGELAACQRYFQRIASPDNNAGPGVVNATSGAYVSITHKQKMRNTATISGSVAGSAIKLISPTGSQFTVTGFSAAVAGDGATLVNATIGSASLVVGQGTALLVGNPDYIDLSAEL